MDARSLSPRLKRVIRECLPSDRAQKWETSLAAHVDTVMGVTVLYETPGALMVATGIERQGEAATLWQAADSEAEAIVLATAKARRVARKYAPQAEPQKALAAPGTIVRKAGRARKIPHAPVRPQDAEGEAKQALEKALEEAYALADSAGPAARRVQVMRNSGLGNAEVRALLRNLFLHKASVASTLTTHLRNVARLRRWAEGKGADMWRLNVVQMASFLRDEGRGGRTVAPMLKSTLDWANFCLDLGWDTTDPIITSMAGKDRKEAKAAREQATPYTKEVVDELVEYHKTADGAEKYTAGFAISMAMAVLRFSDMDRSKDIALNKDCLYGQTWRSKTQPGGMPWAMPRMTWGSYDFGGAHYAQMVKIFPQLQDRNWQWPAVHMLEGKIMFEMPMRHGSYGNCLMAHNIILRAAGVQGDFTLHSPRFFVPGLAGQMGMSLEQRRTLGHWGPNSNMPVRYDQARCCT